MVEQEDMFGTIDIGDDPARVVAQVPRVDAVRIDGSGKVVLRDLHGPRLATPIHGSGEVRVAGLRADDAAEAISGSGSADIGETERLDAEIESDRALRHLT